MADSTKRADDVFDIDRIRKLIQLMKKGTADEKAKRAASAASPSFAPCNQRINLVFG